MHIYKIFTFESAHYLPNVPEGHKCGRMHGHSYEVEVHVQGVAEEHTGWVIDYADIKSAFKPLHDMLDHNLLNEVKGLDNPTSENLARWIGLRLNLDGLYKVVVKETCTCGCTYFIYEG